jgi:hypothetical protein
MIVRYGDGQTWYGPGVAVELTGDEVARAIEAWLVAHGVHISGARTVTVNGELCRAGQLYVDPSGFVIDNGEGFSGRGERGFVRLKADYDNAELDHLPRRRK